MLDVYCERGLVPGLWAEPLNSITNLAFLIAGGFALRVWLSQPDLGVRRGWDLLLLVLLLFAIGIGSGLWHAFATRWAVLADVIPIVLLINLYLVSVLVRALSAPWWGALAGFLAYQALGLGLFRLIPVDALHGSAAYLPALIVLAGLWVALAARRHPLARTFAAAIPLFVVSLAFRTLDRVLCATHPSGTHFVWHLLNGWLLYLLVAGLIRHGRRQGTSDTVRGPPRREGAFPPPAGPPISPPD